MASTAPREHEKRPYEIFKYACHEDNSMIRNYIVTSRHERASNQGAAR